MKGFEAWRCEQLRILGRYVTTLLLVPLGLAEVTPRAMTRSIPEIGTPAGRSCCFAALGHSSVEGNEVLARWLSERVAPGPALARAERP